MLLKDRVLCQSCGGADTHVLCDGEECGYRQAQTCAAGLHHKGSCPSMYYAVRSLDCQSRTSLSACS
jgi:hypothetical protein